MFSKFSGGGSGSGGTGGCVVLLLGAAVIGLAAAPSWAESGAPNWADVEPRQVERGARMRCAGMFPDSYSMQATCLEMSRESARKFRDAVARSAGDSTMQRALARCLRTLRTDGVPDYTLLGTCAEMEAKGRERLRG